jgi:hypothetical protein
LLSNIYEGRPETCFFPHPEFCERVVEEHIKKRIIYPEITGAKVPNMYYRCLNPRMYRTVKRLFEFAGFKVTRDDKD